MYVVFSPFVLEAWKVNLYISYFWTSCKDDSSEISVSFHRSAQQNCRGHVNTCHLCEDLSVCLFNHPSPTGFWQYSAISINTPQKTPDRTTNPKTLNPTPPKPLTFCKDIHRWSVGQEPRPAFELPSRTLYKHRHYSIPTNTQRWTCWRSRTFTLHVFLNRQYTLA